MDVYALKIAIQEFMDFLRLFRINLGLDKKIIANPIHQAFVISESTSSKSDLTVSELVRSVRPIVLRKFFCLRFFIANQGIKE